MGEGDRRAALTALSRALGLTPHVTFTGALAESEVIDVYSRSDTLVLPSTLEVWALVANEALAAGLHAVVTSACGVAPNIRRMKGVTLVEPTVTSIAAGMRTRRETREGPIVKPEMLEHGADGLADALERAIAHQHA
jgi:glycosyltransferase involved in cell wall biosynthesis